MILSTLSVLAYFLNAKRRIRRLITYIPNITMTMKTGSGNLAVRHIHTRKILTLTGAIQSILLIITWTTNARKVSFAVWQVILVTIRKIVNGLQNAVRVMHTLI